MVKRTSLTTGKNHQCLVKWPYFQHIILKLITFNRNWKRRKLYRPAIPVQSRKTSDDLPVLKLVTLAALVAWLSLLVVAVIYLKSAALVAGIFLKLYSHGFFIILW